MSLPKSGSVALSVALPASVLLLTATGLLAQSVPPPSQSANSTEAPVSLSPFVIAADADDGYASTESASASRFKQKLKDIPQTISILSGQFLKDIGAVDLADVMPLLGGTVSGATRNQDTFSMRGFAVQESYLDGIRDVVEWGGGEFAHVQQIEVLKGPSSNLYANPKGLGGIINRVSKAPKEKVWSQLGLIFDDEGSYHFTVDTTGPLGSGSSLLYRVNAAYRQIESYRDFKDTKRFFVAPTATWQFTPKTNLSFYSEILRQEHQEDNWIPAVLNPATGQLGLTVPISRRIDEPWVNSTIEKEVVRLIAEHHFNPNLTARVATFASFINNPIEQVEFVSLAADNRTVNRRGFWLNRWNDNYYTEANLFGRVQRGNIEHSFLLAADWLESDNRVNVRRVNLATADLLAPTYAVPKPAFPASSAVTNTLSGGSTYGYSGTYQLNGFEGRVILIGGWRESGVEAFNYQEVGIGPFPKNVVPKVSAGTPRYGAIIRPIPQVAIYYQYSEVFQTAGAGALKLDGSPLDPVYGSSEEFGLRVNLLAEKLNFEAVKYEVIADGLAVRLPPPNNSFFANGGQNSSDGYEYTLTYNDRRLTAQAGWVTVDVRDTTPGVLGQQIAGQPPERGYVHLRYKWPNVGRHGGLSVGGSIVHTGDRPLSTSATSQKISAYQSYNLNFNYNLNKGLNVACAVTNLTDESSIVANAGILWRPLDPRIVKITLNKSW